MLPDLSFFREIPQKPKTMKDQQKEKHREQFNQMAFLALQRGTAKRRQKKAQQAQWL